MQLNFNECLVLLYLVITTFLKVFIVVDALNEYIKSSSTRRSIIKGIKFLVLKEAHVIVTLRILQIDCICKE